MVGTPVKFKKVRLKKSCESIEKQKLIECKIVIFFSSFNKFNASSKNVGDTNLSLTS